MREYVKVYCCGDCVYYNWKKHKCNRGATDEGKPTDKFYRDCPIGICIEEENAERAESKTVDDSARIKTLNEIQHWRDQCRSYERTIIKLSAALLAEHAKR